MRTDLFKGVVIGAIVATVVSTAAAAVAGTGIGAVFNLGQTNAVNAESTLQGNATGANLQIVQKGSGSALALVVPKNKPPMTVSSGAGKVRNLDADRLDGLDATAFAAGGGRFFTGHIAFAQGDSPANVVSVPRLGMLTASWNGSDVSFSLLNSTGTTADMTFKETGVADGLPITNGQNFLFNIDETTNDEAEVQIAWGSGHAAHFVRLTISWFVQAAPGPHVMVFGYSK